jgi:hypothetical protein
MILPTTNVIHLCGPVSDPGILSLGDATTGQSRESVMARDAGLEELLREDLKGEMGLTEKPMFGGWAWLLRGNLLCGARDDGMLVRLGKDNDGWALALPNIVTMISRGRPMRGWVRVGPKAFGDDALRRKLLKSALDFVRSLPVK